TQASSSGGGSSGGTSSASGSGGGSSSSQSASNAGQPAGNIWSFDNVVRLYHYRDAAGIATAINAAVANGSNSRPIVQALSDFGANDMVEILPAAALQGYTVGD